MVRFSHVRPFFIITLLLLLIIGAFLSVSKLTTTHAAGKKAVEADWSMLGYDPQHTGFNTQEHILRPSNVTRLQLDWHYSMKGFSSFSPVVANRFIFISTTDFKLIALNIKTRMPQWSYSMGDYIQTPTITNGIVYVSSSNSLYALDIQTGVLKWRTLLSSGYLSSPTLVNNVLYVSLSSNSYGGSGTIYALDARYGSVKWIFATQSMGCAVPTVADGVVYVNSFGRKHGGGPNSYLYAINAFDGTLKWRVWTREGVRSYPVVKNSLVYMSLPQNGSVQHFFALNASTGEVKWMYPMSASSLPAVANDTVFVSSTDGYTYALNAQTGIRIWRHLGNGSEFTSLTVANGVVYISSTDHNIYTLNTTTGKNTWHFTLKNKIWSSPIIANGKLYVDAFDSDTYDSVLYVFHLPY